MSLLRFLMLLSLIVWIGGLILFAFVVAPTAFALLPTRHLAGKNGWPDFGKSALDGHFLRACLPCEFACLQPAQPWHALRLGRSPHSDRSHARPHSGLTIRHHPPHGFVAGLDR